jgi:hypothetical protein
MNSNAREFFHRVTIAALLSMALFALPAFAAAPIKVSSATPSAGEQGATALLVTIAGSSFPANPAVKFCRSDTGTTTCDPDKISVVSVRYVSSSKVEAVINIDATATVTNFDIEVIEPLSGRKGRGTALFKVESNGTREPQPQQVSLGAFEPDLLFTNYPSGTGGTKSARVANFDGLLWADVEAQSAQGACAWSPDGRWVLYSKARQVKSKGGTQTVSDVFARRTDGSGTPQAVFVNDPSYYANINAGCTSTEWTPALGNGKQYLLYPSPYVGYANQLMARAISCGDSACTLGPAIQLTNQTDCCMLGDFRFSASDNRLGMSFFRPAGAGGNSTHQIDLYTLGFAADGRPELRDRKILAQGLETWGPMPRFTARIPGRVLYLIKEPEVKAEVWSVGFDDPLDRKFEGLLPEPGNAYWELNDNGDMLFSVGSGTFLMRAAVPASDPFKLIDGQAYQAIGAAASGSGARFRPMPALPLSN